MALIRVDDIYTVWGPFDVPWHTRDAGILEAIMQIKITQFGATRDAIMSVFQT